MATKLLYIVVALAVVGFECNSLRISPKWRGRAAAGLLSIGLGMPGLANADLFGPPAGLSDLKEKPQNYGRMADVGVREFVVKNGKQHLREATPIGQKMQFSAANTANTVTKRVTDNLELIRLRLEQVGKTNKPGWNAVGVDMGSVVADVTGPNKAQLMGGNSKKFEETVVKRLPALVDAVKRNDADETFVLQEEVAQAFNDIQVEALPKKKLPYTIPEEYNNLPRLLGRATVDITIESKANKGKGFKFDDPTSPTGTNSANALTFTVVVDGYTHPLAGGNFIDNVLNKKYDNVPIKAEELIVQTQTPTNKQGRSVPLELFYKVDEEPTYSITSDDDGRALDTQRLPFQAYGAIGMARGEDVDSAQEDFFFLKWRQALVAPGRNTLDGYYSCLGYVVSDNVDLLGQVEEKGGKIVSAKVVAGADNLVMGTSK